MEKRSEKLECKASKIVSPEDPNTFLRPWLKPTFEREAMKEALTGNGNNFLAFDGTGCPS